MIDIEEVLKPVSHEKSCGEDLTYDPKFQELEDAAKPPPPSSPDADPEEPNWKEVRDKSIELLGQSKHLRAAVLLTVSLVKIGGAEGMRDGFAVTKGIVEKYWPDLYPRLDPDDNNDPTERLNTLSSLSHPKFVFQLQQIPLCDSPGLGRITLAQYLAAKDAAKAPAGEDGPPKTAGPGMDQINAAFRDSDPDTIKTTLAFVDEALAHAQGIETFIDEKLGVGNGVNFESLNKSLKSMRDAVAPFANNGSSEEPAASADGEEAASTPARGGSRGGALGAINSGDDVIKQIDLICDYYRRNEPSSPVPLILHRAKNLVNKDFTAIMSDLTPAAIEQLNVITGAKPKSSDE